MSTRKIVCIKIKYEAVMDIINKKKTRNQVCLDLKIAQSTLVQWIKTKDKIITEYQDDGTTSKTKRV